MIKEFEGLRLSPYKDPAGHATIGYGHLIKSGETFGEAISEAQADSLLRQDVQIAVVAVCNLVKVPLVQNQFDALVSFVFNVGAKAFEDSTLLRLLNAGDYRGAADQFPRWNKAAINRVLVPLPGLTRRRARERQVFLNNEDRD